MTARYSERARRGQLYTRHAIIMHDHCQRGIEEQRGSRGPLRQKPIWAYLNARRARGTALSACDVGMRYPRRETSAAAREQRCLNLINSFKRVRVRSQRPISPRMPLSSSRHLPPRRFAKTIGLVALYIYIADARLDIGLQSRVCVLREWL